MNTYLIANGGCGERLSSVMLMLYQCKFYGSADPIKGVLIIDNDSTNPAKVRLDNIINAVNNMNSAIGRDDVPKIESKAWAPKIGDAQCLNGLLSSDPEYEALGLISTAEELQQTIEGKGYAGHVNIGVTLVNTALEMQNGANSKVLYDFLNDSCPKQGGEEARFIIIGSTHGGTGAALNTAIARKIRSYYKGCSANIDVYGLFMMSYYSIPPRKNTGNSDEKDKIHIDPNQFRPADIEALEGYRGMNLINEADPVFDNILLCGFDPRPLTNIEHQEGGNKQDNRFSIPELLMCAGANFIFKGDVERNRYLGIDLDKFDGTLRWSNMPYGEELKEALGGMGLFICSITEDVKDAACNKLLLSKISGHFTKLFYMTEKNKTKELPSFNNCRNSADAFAVLFWDMLYQMSTNVNEAWNDKIALLKKNAIVKRPTPDGFGWVNDNMVDATIINFDGAAFAGVDTPSMFSFNNVFRRELERNLGNIRTESEVGIRVKAYYHALFDASYATYGEEKNNG